MYTGVFFHADVFRPHGPSPVLIQINVHFSASDCIHSLRHDTSNKWLGAAASIHIIWRFKILKHGWYICDLTYLEYNFLLVHIESKTAFKTCKLNETQKYKFGNYCYVHLK